VQGYLTSSLFKQVAHVFFALEVAHALGAYDTLGPLACNEVVKVAEVERAAAIEHPGAYAVLVAMWVFGIVMVTATAMPVFVVMVMMSAMWASLFILILMMMFVAIMVMMLVLALMVMMLVFMVVLMMLLLMMRLVQFLYPFG
jgi:hypothetical protein